MKRKVPTWEKPKPDVEKLSKEIDRLREENERLRQEVEKQVAILLDRQDDIKNAERYRNLDVEAAARAIFSVMKYSNMVETDWDSGAILGLNNAFRNQISEAAQKAIDAARGEG